MNVRPVATPIPPAVVLDLSANGIGIIRSLYRQGIMVYGFDVAAKYRLGKTRYATCAVCPDPVLQASQLVQFLLEWGRGITGKAVLYAGSDDYVEFISRYREVLDQRYVFLLPDPGLVEAVLDKRLTYRLALAQGLDCPQTFIIENPEQLAGEIIPRLKFPCILKPASSSNYRKRLNRKAIPIENPRQLLQEYPYFRQFGEMLVQERIPGGESCLIGVGTFFDAQMRCVGLFCGQKIHQYPPVFGSGSAVRSRRDEEAMALTRTLFEALRFYGIAKIEWKRDPRDGRLKFIEINARTWYWHSLAMRCGVNLPYLYYASLTGADPAPAVTQSEGITWIYGIRELLAFFYRPRPSPVRWWRWLQELGGHKEWALFVWDDPLPAIRSAMFHVKNLWRHRV